MTPINPILVLRVAHFDGQPVAEPISCEFGPAGGSIGRATDCTLALPDPQRSISRVQARIECRDGSYLFCDQGGNPSQLNGSAIGGTREARLKHGDRLTVGAYQIEVLIAEKSSPLLHDTLAAAQVLGGPLGSGTSYTDTLDVLGQPAFGAPAPVSAQPRYAGSVSDHVAAEFQAFAAPRMGAQPAAATIPPTTFGAPAAPAVPAMPATGGEPPARHDPLDEFFAQWEASPVSPAAPPPLGGFGGIAPAQAVPAPSGAPPAQAVAFPPVLQTPSAAMAMPVAPVQGGPTGLTSSLLDDPLPGEGSPFGDLFAPIAGAGTAGGKLGADFDPLAPMTPAPSGAPDNAGTAPATSPSVALDALVPPAAAAAPAPAAVTPMTPMTPMTPGIVSAPDFDPLAPMTAPAPALAQASVPAAAPAAVPAPPVAPADASVVAALMAGLGLDPTRAPNLPPADFARLTGGMLREALRGTMAVLRSRSMTKREARLDTTVIVERDNNPLKFFPDVDSALIQMLTGRAAGYLPPDQALAHAFADIEAHGLAVIAGMRAALSGVLARFDPAALEAELEEPGMLDKLLSNRKARLWDRFVEQKARIARESEDDFQQLFGRAFNEAYEAQIDALLAARKRGEGA